MERRFFVKWRKRGKGVNRTTFYGRKLYMRFLRARAMHVELLQPALWLRILFLQ